MAMIHGIKVLVIDHSDTSRQRIHDELTEQSYSVIDASCEEEALEKGLSFFDVIVLEVNLPRNTKTFIESGLGIQIGIEARRKNRSTGILFFSFDEDHIRQAEDLYREGDGGVGYISKKSSFKVASAIPLVAVGNWISVLSKPITTSDMEGLFLRGLTNTTREKVLDITQRLSELREDELIMLRKIGCSNQIIARNLHLAVNTVEAKFTSIYLKLGLENIDRRLRPILIDRALSIFDLHRKSGPT